MLFMLTAPLQPHAAQHDALGEVRIHLYNLRSNNGKLLLTLFRTASGFPDDPEQAFAILSGGISNHEAHLSFRKIPYGTVAVSVIHDENNNGKLDFNFLGIPTEGYGASNNAAGYMGAPKFDKASLMLNEPLLETSIELKYWL